VIRFSVFDFGFSIGRRVRSWESRREESVVDSRSSKRREFRIEFIHTSNRRYVEGEFYSSGLGRSFTPALGEPTYERTLVKVWMDVSRGWAGVLLRPSVMHRRSLSRRRVKLHDNTWRAQPTYERTLVKVWMYRSFLRAFPFRAERSCKQKGIPVSRDPFIDSISMFERASCSRRSSEFVS